MPPGGSAPPGNDQSPTEQNPRGGSSRNYQRATIPFSPEPRAMKTPRLFTRPQPRPSPLIGLYVMGTTYFPSTCSLAFFLVLLRTLRLPIFKHYRPTPNTPPPAPMPLHRRPESPERPRMIKDTGRPRAIIPPKHIHESRPTMAIGNDRLWGEESRITGLT